MLTNKNSSSSNTEQFLDTAASTNATLGES